ncbi:Acb2/Tad1 domain-containing protein [Herbidospora cretacea]|uniref:Acb2/Tad1 domain-containing protein n=1 Tax=Herbidospora cretacea TaxID=28444 RepID=UPI0009ECEF5E
MTPEDIEWRFAFHAATNEEKRDAHTSVRQAHRRLADDLNSRLPEGREKSLAITKLEESMFWSNAAIARNKE